MPVRPDRNQIPTIRQGIDRFLLHCEAAGQKSLKDHISVLRGTTGRVTGKAAKGPALAQSELGGLRFDRATAEDIDRWFLARVPVSLAPATRKRARSIQRQLVRYAIGQGWAEERLLACCPTLPDSEPRSEWLYPEEVDVLARVLLADGTIDPYERFLYEVALDAGARCEELCALRRSDADRRAGVLRIRGGKGRGTGKDRTIPVTDAFL